jgi:transposase-like protein
VPLAALHGALRPRHASALPPQRAAVGLRGAQGGLRRRVARGREGALRGGDRAPAGTAPKVSELLEEAEEDLLAFYRFPEAHWTKLRSTNPLERVNREIGRRSDVVGIFPNDAAVIRLVGALLIEQNDEWLVGRRYLSEESISLILEPEIEDSPSLDRKEVAELKPA